MSDNDLVPDSPESAVDPSVWDSFKSWLDPQGQRNDLAGKGVGPLFDAGLRRALFNAMSFIDDPKTLDPVNAAMSFAGMTPAIGGVIKGFHGTPYKFEPVEHNPFGEFRDSAIGSGEGAQAYGYGHYVAGKKGVAQYYRDSLATTADSSPWTYKGVPLVGPVPAPANIMDELSPEVYSAIIETMHGSDNGFLTEMSNHANMRKGLEEFIKTAKEISPEDPATMHENTPGASGQEALDWWNKNEEHLHADLNNKDASLYDIEINTDPEQLLDWDAAVPAAIKNKVLETAKRQYPDRNSDWNRLQEIYGGADYAVHSGNRFYKDLSDFLPKAKTSQLLNDAGIPGIKYLDQGSRDTQLLLDNQPIINGMNLIPHHAISALKMYEGDPAHAVTELKRRLEHADAVKAYDRADEIGEGIDWIKEHGHAVSVAPQTHNYVIFNPKHLKITARNGVPLERIEHDPFEEKP